MEIEKKNPDIAEDELENVNGGVLCAIRESKKSVGDDIELVDKSSGKSWRCKKCGQSGKGDTWRSHKCSNGAKGIIK